MRCNDAERRFIDVFIRWRVKVPIGGELQREGGYVAPGMGTPRRSVGLGRGTS